MSHRSRIVSSVVCLALTAVAASAQDAPPPPPPGWTGSFGAGYSLAKGNSDTNNINLSFDTKRDTGSPFLFTSTGLFLRGQSDGELDTNRLGLDARLDRKFAARTSAYVQVAYLHDEFKDIEYLLGTTVGLGQQLVKNDRTEFAVDAGLGVVWEKNPDVELDTSGALTAGQNFKHKLTETAEITQKVSALWKTKDFDDALYIVSVGMAASVTTRTQMKVELVETFKNKPPAADVKKSDVALVVSFVFKY